jgi:hypothetical protein
MLRKSAAHQKKVESAVWILQTTTGVNVAQAMILAGFSKSDSANKIVRQQVQRHLVQKGSLHKNRMDVVVDIYDAPSLSDLTGDDDAASPPVTRTMASSYSGPMNPKPKRKQIRPTASAIQQLRVDNLAA